jgi:hypothetical protein
LRNQILFVIITILLTFTAIASIQWTNHENSKFQLIVYCKNNYTTNKILILEFNSPTIANLSFIHSVHKTPIYDILLVNSTGFYGIQHWTKAFGAGEPDTAADAGAKRWVYDPNTGFYIFKGMNRPLGKTLYLPIDISYNMSITILYHGQPIKLDEKQCNHTMIIVDYSPNNQSSQGH